MGRPKRFFALILALALSPNLVAADLSLLQGELWEEIEPITDLDMPQPKPEFEPLTRAIFDQARTYFSGMIYGYTFRYRPSDKARQITESYAISPVYVMPWGTKGMQYAQGEIRDTLLVCQLRYTLTIAEQERLAHWLDASIPAASGIGLATLTDSKTSRTKAFDAACKEAVRAYARGLTHNKPDEISGRFVLASLPYFRYYNGQYEARVDLRLQVTKIDPYRTY